LVAGARWSSRERHHQNGVIDVIDVIACQVAEVHVVDRDLEVLRITEGAVLMPAILGRDLGWS